MSEIPTKPYLLRALYEWCVDSGYTPYVTVSVDARTQVPTEHVRDGQITLNISPSAVHKLQMGNESIEFSARFAGVARQISVPVENVRALYARETGQGMSFELEPATRQEPAREPAPEADAGAPAGDTAGQPRAGDTPPEAQAGEAPPEPRGPGPKGPPRLRRIK